MKYLRLHRLVWAILVVAYTSFEGLLILGVYLLYIIWNIKIPKGFWREAHTGEEAEATWSGKAYSDKNMWETIKRRYHALCK